MAKRVINLKSVLTTRGCLGIWENEDMNLWRMTTMDQPEAWFAPSGEELPNAEAVAAYLSELPPDGSRGKFFASAPFSDWTLNQVEIQESGRVDEWTKANILKRESPTSSVCLLQYIPSGEKKWVDLIQVRARWCPPDPQKHATNMQLKQKQLAPVSSLRKKGNLLGKKKLSEESFVKTIMELRRVRLKNLCENGAKVLQGVTDKYASNLASFLETVHYSLQDLESNIDPEKELPKREDVTALALQDFLGNDEVDKQGWCVRFIPNFDSGYCDIRFEKNNDIIQGIANMGKHLRAYQYSIDETEEGWSYFKNLDIITAVELELHNLAKKKHLT